MRPPPPMPDAFDDARRRFRAAAEEAGALLHRWPVGPESDDLAIEAARLGPEDAPGLVVVSSGLHGVEGPLGSAVQSSWLEGPGPRALPGGVAVLLLHALNPFGFRHSRRFDASNVDLNRNFLPPGEAYRGHPPLYARLDPMLNPPGPPGRLDAIGFPARAAWAQLRFGAEAVKQAVAGGQYDFPRGLFFGGHAPSEAFLLLDRHLPGLVGPARSVVHLDFHTGLGPRGSYVLLVDGPADSPSTARLSRAFGPDRIESHAPGGTSYHIRGNFGVWCSRRLGGPGRSYDYTCAEFGTYPGPVVIGALREENRAHHHCPPGSPALLRARARLRESFIPAAPPWRSWALAEGLGLVARAVSHLATAPAPADPAPDPESGRIG
ncbi:M14 family metallopeptidase [Tautonia plasticadhaerens]|uniref:DUF2817 domain-containing protein n=1 Tax=Tautonia plasticadhaerens TaxID=2527974 RepID=A0A518H2F2_9BACT|nr:M14 family metallopeptidase [Tautonia plasticadhaerens]QDV35018.1 hypothetical protein ElP_29150 [Tautonia plasticadhaerens]